MKGFVHCFTHSVDDVEHTHTPLVDVSAPPLRRRSDEKEATSGVSLTNPSQVAVKKQSHSILVYFDSIHPSSFIT